MRQLRGACALITGAASGIGRAIALELAGQGVRLWLLDINEDALTLVAEAAILKGVEVVAQRCDLGDPGQISAAVANLRGQWGRLDLLVNNAAVAIYASTAATTISCWNRILDINLIAPVQLIQETLPLLLSRSAEHPQAHILNMGSFLGLVPYRRTAAYQTTKYAIVGLSQTLRAELADVGVGVSVICPGFVRDTGLFSSIERTEQKYRQSQPPAWITCTPEHVARRTVRAIKGNHGMVIITPLARLVWWWSRLTPWMIDWMYQFNGWVKSRRRRKHRKAQSAPKA